MKNYNALDMKGRLFDYTLEADENDKGALIKGEIKLEVDEAGTVVTLRYHVNEKTNAGKINKTYGVLEDMLAGNYKTVTADGDEAAWFALTGNIDVSYFIGRNSSDGELVRSQKLRGGFVNDNKEKKYLNKWKLDFLITDVKEIDADAEKQLDRFVKVSGYLVDDYRKRVMEVQFQARSEKAMDYILANISPSFDNPYFVATWGSIVKMSRLVVRKNAFGEDEEDSYDSIQWAIVGMNPEAYAFGDEAVMTTDEYAEFRANLEEHKEEKANGDDADGGSGKKPELAF